MKNLILLTVITVIFFGCKNESKKNRSYFDLQKDTIFYMSLPEDAREIIFSVNQTSFMNKMFDNIYISIYENRNKFHFIIKEFAKDSIKRFYYFQKKVFYIKTQYDSSKYDDMIFCKINSENNYTYADSLSYSFFNIHKLRKKDKYYQSYFKENNNKLKEIENIINNTDAFKNFSLKDSHKVYLLKEFLFLLRMSTLNYDEYNTSTLTTDMFNFAGIGIIENNNLSELERYIKISETDYNKKILSSYWQHQNNLFLLKKMPELKEKLKEKGSFILYTQFPETKVFLYNISVVNNKIKLKETYINKDYYWFHPYYGIPTPALRM